MRISGPPAANEKAPPWGRRLLWFFGLAIAAGLATAAVAYVLRALLFAA